MSSSQIVEDYGGASGSSRKEFLRTGSRSFRDDWQFQRQDLSPLEMLEMLEEHSDDAPKLRSTLHSLRNGYKSGHEYLVEPVKQLMQEHEDDVRLLDVACGALWRMAADNVPAKRCIVESGSIDIVIDAIGKCRYDADFVQWAMGTIASVATEDENKEYVSQRNAIQSVLETLKEHQNKAGVFEWSFRCLYALLATHQGNDASSQSLEILTSNIHAIEDFDGIQIIVDAMKVHERESAAQILAMNVLWRLLDRGGVAANADRCRNRPSIGTFATAAVHVS